MILTSPRTPGFLYVWPYVGGGGVGSFMNVGF